MNRQKTLLSMVFLLLTGSMAGLIFHAHATQRLGIPGVRTEPLPGTSNLRVILPDHMPGYTAWVTNEDPSVVTAVPADTSFGRCIYTAPDGFVIAANVVLMGTDRISIHKPQECLTGQGWVIDESSHVETLHMAQPAPYDLPVMRLDATYDHVKAGHRMLARGVYVYWFVDGSKYTPYHLERMWWMARDMVRTGVLDRFAYIAYFSYCAPGQEEATFERMKKVMVETVPKFQLVPRPGATAGGS